MLYHIIDLLLNGLDLHQFICNVNDILCHKQDDFRTQKDEDDLLKLTTVNNNLCRLNYAFDIVASLFLFPSAYQLHQRSSLEFPLQPKNEKERSGSVVGTSHAWSILHSYTYYLWWNDWYSCIVHCAHMFMLSNFLLLCFALSALPLSLSSPFEFNFFFRCFALSNRNHFPLHSIVLHSEHFPLDSRRT